MIDIPLEIVSLNISKNIKYIQIKTKKQQTKWIGNSESSNIGQLLIIPIHKMSQINTNSMKFSCLYVCEGKNLNNLYERYTKSDLKKGCFVVVNDLTKNYKKMLQESNYSSRKTNVSIVFIWIPKNSNIQIFTISIFITIYLTKVKSLFFLVDKRWNGLKILPKVFPGWNHLQKLKITIFFWISEKNLFKISEIYKK